MDLNYKILNGGFKPLRAHKEDAGFDLYTPEDQTIPAGGFVFIPLKVCVEVPKGYVGLLMGRSSLNRGGVNAFTGVIDAGYTGEIGVTLFNATSDNYNIRAGERIAQLVICKIADIENLITKPFQESERGSNGYGSTGK